MIAILKPANQVAAGAMAAAFGGSAGPNFNAMDHLSIVKGHVRGLLADIRTALPKTTDPATKLHLLDVSDRLKEALEPSK